jgi:hypothetical protein
MNHSPLAFTGLDKNSLPIGNCTTSSLKKVALQEIRCSNSLTSVISTIHTNKISNNYKNRGEDRAELQMPYLSPLFLGYSSTTHTRRVLRRLDAPSITFRQVQM